MRIDNQKLREFGIVNDGRKKQYCPLCRDKRKNKRDKSLSVDWDRCIAHCHHCGESFFFGETEKREYAAQPVARYEAKEQGYRKPGKLSCEEPLDANMLAWFAGRGIAAELLLQEGITKVCRKMPQTGNVERCIVFPYWAGGNLVNRKYRDGAKNFMLESGAQLVPWRIDHIKDTEECIITEGEMDALSFLAIGRKDVVSVPNGAQRNLAWMDEFIETHFENKRRVYIAVDVDEKGGELRNELVRRLGDERCRIVYYNDCKDANELLVSDGTEALKKALECAEEIPLNGVFTTFDVKDDLQMLFENGVQKGAVLKMGLLDDLISLETGRIMVMTGIPGDGKSEFLDEMAVRLSLSYDWRCAYFSPENFPVTLHFQKLVEKMVGKRFLKGVMPQLEYDTAVDYLGKNFFEILPEDGYQVDTILEKAEALVRRKGIRLLVLDPYNCLEHQIPKGQSETQYISEFLEKLRSFARRKQVLVVLAAHPVKLKKDPLTKRFPVPTMYDICGSAAFFNKADYGIAVERDRPREVTRIHVQKVKFRHQGYPGVASFKYNNHNGRFVSFDEPSTPDLPDPDVTWDNSNWLAAKLSKPPVQTELFVA